MPLPWESTRRAGLHSNQPPIRPANTTTTSNNNLQNNNNNISLLCRTLYSLYLRNSLKQRLIWRQVIVNTAKREACFTLEALVALRRPVDGRCVVTSLTQGLRDASSGNAKFSVWSLGHFVARTSCKDNLLIVVVLSKNRQPKTLVTGKFCEIRSKVLVFKSIRKSDKRRVEKKRCLCSFYCRQLYLCEIRDEHHISDKNLHVLHSEWQEAWCK